MYIHTLYFIILHNSNLPPLLQETAVAEVENETAKSQLQITSLTAQLRRLQEVLNQQNATVDKQNSFISQSEAEIGRNNALIERKQTQIDQLNKKIGQKLAKMDGVRNYFYFVAFCVMITCVSFYEWH